MDHDEIHAREIRMRCLEVAGQSSAHAGAHKDGPAAAVLESAEKFAAWVMGPAPAQMQVEMLL